MMWVVGTPVLCCGGVNGIHAFRIDGSPGLILIPECLQEIAMIFLDPATVLHLYSQLKPRKGWMQPARPLLDLRLANQQAAGVCSSKLPDTRLARSLRRPPSEPFSIPLRPALTNDIAPT
jgi:hypothetical protein